MRTFTCRSTFLYGGSCWLDGIVCARMFNLEPIVSLHRCKMLVMCFFVRFMDSFFVELTVYSLILFFPEKTVYWYGFNRYVS
jgi:hypothetical protein